MQIKIAFGNMWGGFFPHDNTIPYWATPEYIMTILTRFLEA